MSLVASSRVDPRPPQFGLPLKPGTEIRTATHNPTAQDPVLSSTLSHPSLNPNGRHLTGNLKPLQPERPMPDLTIVTQRNADGTVVTTLLHPENPPKMAPDHIVIDMSHGAITQQNDDGLIVAISQQNTDGTVTTLLHPENPPKVAPDHVVIDMSHNPTITHTQHNADGTIITTHENTDGTVFTTLLQLANPSNRASEHVVINMHDFPTVTPHQFSHDQAYLPSASSRAVLSGALTRLLDYPVDAALSAIGKQFPYNTTINALTTAHKDTTKRLMMAGAVLLLSPSTAGVAVFAGSEAVNLLVDKLLPGKNSLGSISVSGQKIDAKEALKGGLRLLTSGVAYGVGQSEKLGLLEKIEDATQFSTFLDGLTKASSNTFEFFVGYLGADLAGKVVKHFRGATNPIDTMKKSYPL